MVLAFAADSTITRVVSDKISPHLSIGSIGLRLLVLPSGLGCAFAWLCNFGFAIWRNLFVLL
jgi:hypothetical protein